jgi:hypothetical protein
MSARKKKLVPGVGGAKYRISAELDKNSLASQ